jgi:hypothetical protein
VLYLYKYYTNIAKFDIKMGKRNSYKTGLQHIEVNNETGEILKQTITTEVIEGYKDVKLPEKHFFPKSTGSFITLFQDSMKLIAQNGRKYFTKDELIILIYLLGTAGIANSIVIDYPLLVSELGIQRTNSVTAVKSLIRKGVVIKQSEYRGGLRSSKEMQLTVNFDQLNYSLAYNGKIKEFKEKQFIHPKLTIGEEIDKKQLGLFESFENDK